MNVRLLTAADIPAAMRLKECAGWNQTAEDWQRLLDLEPEGCFAIECDGRLAATTTVVGYGGELAWVGMVLTLPEYRGRGFACALMEHGMEFIAARGIACVKLDATEMGKRLYQRFGFVEECEIERWIRPPGGAGAGPAGAYAPDCALDRKAFGADRTRLLKSLAPLGAASVPGQGFAMGRPGSQTAHFGPCVARSEKAALALLGWFLERHSADPICWDLLPGNREAVTVARGMGFAPFRRLTRMARGSLRADADLTFATAGFEYG